MYTAHVGVALAARAVSWRRDATARAPGARAAVPVAALVAASQFPDWIDVVIGLAGGRDPHELLSHSFVAAAVAAAAAALLCFAARRDARAALVVAALYLSHVPLDFITGRKPTWPGGPVVGACLYDRPAWDFTLEVALVVAGWLLYRRSLRPESRSAPAAWLLVSTLVATQALLDAGQAVRLAHMVPTGERCV